MRVQAVIYILQQWWQPDVSCGQKKRGFVEQHYSAPAATKPRTKALMSRISLSDVHQTQFLCLIRTAHIQTTAEYQLFCVWIVQNPKFYLIYQRLNSFQEKFFELIKYTKFLVLIQLLPIIVTFLAFVLLQDNTLILFMHPSSSLKSNAGKILKQF